MVYCGYNELVNGVYKPTYNWGAPHSTSGKSPLNGSNIPKNSAMLRIWGNERTEHVWAEKNAVSYADQVWFMIDKWYAFNCIYIYAFINQLLTRVYAYKHLFMHTNMCVYINTHTCVYIYIHTHINTHANPRTPCWFLLLGCNICVGAHMTLPGSKEGASVQNADTLFRTCFRYSKLHVCIYI
jgi:hypothetical protein